ncbi:MAG: glutamine--fructose-6-phosphate transaminase (isomerizing) [Eubacteriales bacterium]
MCGIIGYTGYKPCVSKLLSGLYALEYRGYDSAGMALYDEDGVDVFRSKGGIDDFKKRFISELDASKSVCGIAHTRWATHGAPSDINAHPHRVGRVTLVHNGIIENYRDIKKELEKLGYSFSSETDTEVAAALIDFYYGKTGEPLSSIYEAKKRFSGSYAFGIIFDGRHGEIYGAKKDSPLLLGIGDDGIYTASDITAFLPYTKKYVMIEDGEVFRAVNNGFEIYDASFSRTEKPVMTADFDISAAEKGGYAHFMLKEIHEERSAVERTVGPRVKNSLPDFSSERLCEEKLKSLSSVHIVACGTAMHAGLYAKFLIEKYIRIPVFVEIASEFRYQDPILGENTAVIVISQSGETADSLAAVRLAKERGVYTLAFVNVLSSSIAREADDVIYTYAGPEIAVASTKAYTVQTALLALFTVYLSLLRGSIGKEEAKRLTSSVCHELPRLIDEVISREDEIKEVAREIYGKEDMFFIGRGADAYIAMEAALKMKEISYIHAEAYSAGELKHGTISLITDGTPVVTLITQSSVAEKTASNMREALSRGADTFLICGAGLPVPGEGRIFELPASDGIISPILAATVSQLLAYHTALLRGCSVDKPRNLAKSVTVE